MAIARLADLGVFEDIPGTRFEPLRLVTRSEMAVFISRIMNLMTPMNDPLFEIEYGYTPSDVGEDLEVTEDVDESDEVATPFTDLRTVFKFHYDAITQLYELGVVSGISPGKYGPHMAITRGAMAEFMAAMLDHSNARPAGLAIRASTLSGWGNTSVTLVVSVRDENHSPLADQVVDIFAGTDHHGLTDAGECNLAAIHLGDCSWGRGDQITDANGNIFIAEGITGGDTSTFYAWIGGEELQVFDADEVSYASTSVVTRRAQTSLLVTGTNERSSTIDSDADLDSDNDEPQVDLGSTRSVTLTVQLVRGATEKVPRPDVEITATIVRIAAVYDNGNDKSYLSVFPVPDGTILTTRRNGSATFTIERPEDDEEDDRQEFLDVITFTAGNLTAMQKVRWIEEERFTYSADGVAPDYVILDRNDAVRVNATVTLYDQYGKGFRQARDQRVTIDFAGADESDTGTVQVRTNGVASRRATFENQSAGTEITVSYTPVDVPDDPVELDEVVTDPPDDKVSVVVTAGTADVGLKDIHTLYANPNVFTTEIGKADDLADNADRVYRYDSNDIFYGHGHRFGLQEFEELLANPTDDQGNPSVNQAVVDVVSYNPRGTSIFWVITDSSGTEN